MDNIIIERALYSLEKKKSTKKSISQATHQQNITLILFISLLVFIQKKSLPLQIFQKTPLHVELDKTFQFFWNGKNLKKHECILHAKIFRVGLLLLVVKHGLDWTRKRHWPYFMFLVHFRLFLTSFTFPFSSIHPKKHPVLLYNIPVNIYISYHHITFSLTFRSPISSSTLENLIKYSLRLFFTHVFTLWAHIPNKMKVK